MKLIIQVPCLNEAESLPATLAALPRAVDGFECVEVLVIDDGSTDGTAAVAVAHGADHVVRLSGHQGLARAFMAGLTRALALGADAIVNTDADNQYAASSIPALLAPLLAGDADLVLGARPLRTLGHFSRTKRVLQRLGTLLVRRMTHADVQDATTGFRAFTRDAALRLNVFTRFTYTLETLIQAAASNLRIASVPVRVNGPTRPSRLFRSNARYVFSSILTVFQVYLIYRPARLFSLTALIFLTPGFLLGVRYLLLMAAGEGKGHVHSLIAAALLILCGVIAGACGVVAHLLGINRRLLEELRTLARGQSPARDNGPFAAAGLREHSA